MPPRAPDSEFVALDRILTDAASATAVLRAFLCAKLATVSRIVGIVLGSGLGGIEAVIENATITPYAEIEDLPVPTAQGHAGNLIRGTCKGIEVALLAGRVHLYEGYSASQVTAGIRLLHQLGVRDVVITNAAGGIGEHLTPGDLVLISDHINLQGANPLIGAAPSFPDMTEAYSPLLRQTAGTAARDLGISVKEGVYAGVLGPSYETPAEIRFLARIGADLVGMSTVLEVIAANALGMQVLGISCVTNKAAGLGQGKLKHEEVLAVGRRARDTLIRLLSGLIPRIAEFESI